MADNLPISQGSGATVATDQVGGAHYQRIKVSDGTADSANNWTIDSAGRGEVTLLGNVTIDSLPNITVGAALPAGDNNIGNVDIVSGTVTAVTDITNPIAIKGNITLSDPKTFIGLTTVVQSSTSRSILGNITIDSGTVSLTGNVTVEGINKTWLTKNFGFSATNLSGATVFVGTSSVKYNITNIILSANATVGINIMSGVTYLTGNASVRIKLNSAGGFVENGSVLSPVYKGLADQQSFSIVMDEAVPVAGKITYFEE